MTVDEAQTVLLARHRHIEAVMEGLRKQLIDGQQQLDAIMLAIEALDRLPPA